VGADGVAWQVRRLGVDDAAAYAEIRRRGLVEDPLAFAASPEDDRALEPGLLREALASRSQATFGAFAPGLVGVVGIYRDSHRKTAHKTHLWGLYVAPEHRAAGVGRALVVAALGFARELSGVTRVQLGVAETAGPALRLYRSLGFVSWGTEPDALRAGSTVAAVHHMTLALDRPRS
jgi:ribosomal protein S18 acetylase RimI-like enzyme